MNPFLPYLLQQGNNFRSLQLLRRKQGKYQEGLKKSNMVAYEEGQRLFIPQLLRTATASNSTTKIPQLVEAEEGQCHYKSFSTEFLNLSPLWEGEEVEGMSLKKKKSSYTRGRAWHCFLPWLVHHGRKKSPFHVRKKHQREASLQVPPHILKTVPCRLCGLKTLKSPARWSMTTLLLSPVKRE